MGSGRSQRSLDWIEASYQILEEIQPASVRAVCYQLFRPWGLIPNMDKEWTDKVSVQLVWAREQGIIPWEWIVDPGREPRRYVGYKNVPAFFSEMQHGYARDLWADQPDLVEVWSEKSTVEGTLAPVLDEFRVTFRPLRGHTSATRIREGCRDSDTRRLTAFYVGDRDPSGMHMSEKDLPKRIERYEGDIELRRITLTADDCYDAKLSDKSFPAITKKQDKRYPWYQREYGDLCWELDTQEPPITRARVRNAILSVLDADAWDRSLEMEREDDEFIEREIARLAKKYAKLRGGR